MCPYFRSHQLGSHPGDAIGARLACCCFKDAKARDVNAVESTSAGLLPISHRAVRALALYRLLAQLRHADVAVLRAVRSVHKLPTLPAQDVRAVGEPKLDEEGTGRLGIAVHDWKYTYRVAREAKICRVRCLAILRGAATAFPGARKAQLFLGLGGWDRSPLLPRIQARHRGDFFPGLFIAFAVHVFH